LGLLLSLGKLIGTFYLTCRVFILVVLGATARFRGFGILKFIRYIRGNPSSGSAPRPRNGCCRG
jgi:aerobic C4-dicarboxylate transport protein